LGGTDLFAPLRSLHLLSGATKPPRNVFLFTDGQIKDEDHVTRSIAQHAQRLRLFTFGFGPNCRLISIFILFLFLLSYFSN
jgi:hypothetical protein